MRNYLYVSNSAEAWMNIAVDEWFLENAPGILLYIYVNNPSVIIGRNQNAWKECDYKAMEHDGVQLSRRVSGGGAVYHDEGNLNFSFIMPAGKYDLERQLNVILNTARTLGIDAHFSGRNDILVGDAKFSGNAFCSRKNRRLHHGTMLISSDLDRLSRYLTVSENKVHSKGVDSVRSRVCNLSDIAKISVKQAREALISEYEKEYGTFECQMPPYEFEVHPLYKKHSSWEWCFGKNPQCDIEVHRQFEWGEAQLLFSLSGGIVEELEVYTDALDVDIPQKLRCALIGSKFDESEMNLKIEAIK